MKKLLWVLPLLLLTGCATYPNEPAIEEEPIVQEPVIEQQVVQTAVGFQVIPRLTEDFVNRYKYEDSKRFCVALKINGQYFNVFRNGNNGVSNSKKHGLDGCIPMNQISRGYNTESPDYRTGSRTIYYDQEYAVAKKPNQYGFVYATFTREDFLSGLELDYSPVKEKVEYLELYTSEYFE